MLRSLGVIVFITIVGGAALYFAQRKTVAKGDVLEAELMESTPTLKALECHDRVPIGLAGATFACRAEFKNGDSADYEFEMNRAGQIRSVRGTTQSAPRIKKTSDPWGD